MTTRRSSAAHPNDFAHPYLNTTTPLPKKREFGLCNLFLFKMCGCFSVDELPPPDYEAPIYQPAKSSSSNLTFHTNTTTTRTPTTSPTQSPAKETLPSPTLSTSTNVTSPASRNSHQLVGSTGVEDIPYRRPPQPKPNPQKPVYNRSISGSANSGKFAVYHQTVGRSRIVENWESRAPVELAESDQVETRKIVGNVSRLSAMFDQG